MAGENLQPGSVASTDGLGCFREVKAAGCEYKPHLTGGGEHGCEVPALLRVNTILGKVKRSLDGISNALGPHYASHNLGEFRYRFNRRCDLAALPRRML